MSRDRRVCRWDLDWYPDILDIFSFQLQVEITSPESTPPTVHCGTQLLLSVLLYPHHSFGNGFRRRTSPFLWVLELSPCLSNTNSRLSSTQVLFFSGRLVLDRSVLNISTPLKKAVSSQFTPVQYNYRLQIDGADSKENTVPYCCVTRITHKESYICCLE
jgi:hypothetical protein